MTFLFIGIIFDIAKVLSFVFVFHYNLNNIDLNGWIASSTAFLVAFIIFESLDLRLTWISRRRIVGLSFVLILILLISLIFIFFGQRRVVFWYLKLIFFVLKNGCRLVFAFTSTDFSITFSHQFRSHSWSSNKACIDSYNPLQKYLSRVFSLRVAVKLNFFKTAYRYSWCTTQSKAFSS